MCIDELRFEAAKNRVIGINRERQGIGTLSEKTVHAVLKNYYAPDTDMHEIPIENFVADIFTGTEIIEIQTRSFQVMRRKLDAFLKIYPVTIVYPIPHVKWLSWIDEESGEMSPKRKSPKKGNPYVAFKELYKIRPFLKNENLRFRFALIDMEEYRLLNGWSKDKRKAVSAMTGSRCSLWRKSVLRDGKIICSLSHLTCRNLLLRKIFQNLQKFRCRLHRLCF